jgi:hypothetical protein
VPTRKQRRRQAKERRHEYEYVYVDEDGNEVEGEVEPEEDRAAKPRPAKTGAAPAKKPQGRGRQAASSSRAGRKIDPPSWQRVLRRTAIFAPVMLIVLYFLDPHAGAAAILFQLVVLLALFVPFSYYVDTIMYRQYRKRIGDPLPPRERKPRAR